MKNHRSTRQGYTLIELLAVMFVIAIPGAIGLAMAKKHGTGPGIGAGLLAAVACATVVVLFYRWSWRHDKRRLRGLREKYQTIYRVIALPTDKRIIRKPDGAEIKVGDFGWEAGPILKDGLIYLQGLTVDWRVVWHAGFHPDQIEKIGPKPSSQYDHWVPYWAKSSPPACPFSVQNRVTPNMGLPHYSHRYYGTSAQ